MNLPRDDDTRNIRDQVPRRSGSTAGPAHLIAGDWGTSHLRLFLCDEAGHALDSRSGPGAVQSVGRFAEVLEGCCASWPKTESGRRLPVLLCGMVGSNIGWVEAPYVACPAAPDQIAAACTAPDRDHGRIRIVPGLSCRNPFGAPDFMRSEETQILGALETDAELSRGRRILCLPGTHTKWVELEEGSVQQFFTAPAGELYAVLLEHSVMLRGSTPHGASDAPAAFFKGLRRFAEFPQAQILPRLFECRSRQLSGELDRPEAAEYLSGLLIAADVQGALGMETDSPFPQEIHVIGTVDLARRYSAALACHGVIARRIDGMAAARAGLVHLHRRVMQLERAGGEHDDHA